MFASVTDNRIITTMQAVGKRGPLAEEIQLEIVRTAGYLTRDPADCWGRWQVGLGLIVGYMLNDETRAELSRMLSEIRDGSWLKNVEPEDPASLSSAERESRVEQAQRMIARFRANPRPGDAKFVAFWEEQAEIYSADYPT